ncbi:MAG: hypothetical protein RLZZ511_4460 [Cyanobacteriota bacterium]|jgi:hypothetical protein
MLTFAETQSNTAMEAAIGRRLLALIRPGVVDFASGGGKKCTKGLSCGGSCISKAKVCIKAMNPAQKQQYKALVKAVKAGGEGADKAMEDFKASLKSEGEIGASPPADETPIERPPSFGFGEPTGLDPVVDADLYVLLPGIDGQWKDPEWLNFLGYTADEIRRVVADDPFNPSFDTGSPIEKYKNLLEQQRKAAVAAYNRATLKPKLEANLGIAEDGMTFPNNAEFTKLETIGADSANQNLIFKSQVGGSEYFLKGNSSAATSSEAIYQNQLLSEVATKEVAELVGLGNYYLPVTAREINGELMTVNPFVKGEPAGSGTKSINDRMGEDRERLLALDYVLGSIDRHAENVHVADDGRIFMIDNGLSFAGKTKAKKYSAWADNENVLADGLDKKRPIPGNHISANQEKIIEIAKKRGLPVDGIEQRLERLLNAKTWGDIL